MRVRNALDNLRSSYWFIPAVMAVVATILSFALVSLDRRLPSNFANDFALVYSGGPSGARSMLSAVASSVISVAGTTFSITIAALSLASGQFGPRLLRGFMRDRGNQIVLGIFTATYLYCLLVLRTVRGTEDTTYVPHLSITVAVLLAMISVGVLIYFVHHIAESIQVSRIIDSVGKEIDAAFDRLFPATLGNAGDAAKLPEGEPEPVFVSETGYVRDIDNEGIFKAAQKHDVVVRVELRPGDYAIPGMVLLSVWPRVGDAAKDLGKAYSVERQRTVDQDAEFALLEIAEVAVRALSPGVNDPFTAVSCIDRLTAALCLLAERELPSPYREDDAGRLRVVARPYTYDRLVQAAYRPIRENLGGNPTVTERLLWGIGEVTVRARHPELLAALEAEKAKVPAPKGVE